jgi:hypothetical protein
MWDWGSVLIVVAVVIIAIIAAAFVAFALDQYIVCLRGGYVGSDCMQWERGWHQAVCATSTGA